MNEYTVDAQKEGRRDKDGAGVNEYTVDDQEGREGGMRMVQE